MGDGNPLKDLVPGDLFSPYAVAAGYGLAVSGGPDSLALLHLFAKWHQSLASPKPVMVFTVDHGLRSEAAAEAAFVAQQAEALGLPHKSLVWSHDGVTSRIQERAREARYGLMVDACKAAGLTHLFTAHHAEDQAETVLMRMLKGSGIDGLSGMQPLIERDGVLVARPFLRLRRSELVAYLAQENITAVEDPTNDDPAFERVRLRAALQSLSAAAGKDVVPSLSLFTNRASRAATALQWSSDILMERVVNWDPAGFARLHRPAFGDAPEELQVRVLSKVIGAVSGRGAPKRQAVETIVTLLSAEPSLPQDHTPDDVDHSSNVIVGTLGHAILQKAGNTLFIIREPGRDLPKPYAMTSHETLHWDRRLFLRLETETDQVTVEPLGPRWEKVEQIFSEAERLVLPALSKYALASVWRGDELLAVPGLSLSKKDIIVTSIFPI